MVSHACSPCVGHTAGGLGGERCDHALKDVRLLVFLGHRKHAAEDLQLRDSQGRGGRHGLREQRRVCVHAGGVVKLRRRRGPQLPRRDVRPVRLPRECREFLLQWTFRILHSTHSMHMRVIELHTQQRHVPACAVCNSAPLAKMQLHNSGTARKFCDACAWRGQTAHSTPLKLPR